MWFECMGSTVVRNLALFRFIYPVLKYFDIHACVNSGRAREIERKYVFVQERARERERTCA